MPSPVKAAETENGHTGSSGALDDTSFESELKNLYLGAISDQGDIKYNYDMNYIMQKDVYKRQSIRFLSSSYFLSAEYWQVEQVTHGQ